MTASYLHIPPGLGRRLEGFALGELTSRHTKVHPWTKASYIYFHPAIIPNVLSFIDHITTNSTLVKISPIFYHVFKHYPI
jgi:hypothetical protein